MRTTLLLFGICTLQGMLMSCTSPINEEPVEATDSVWAVDLIKLLPGGEEEYVGNITNNWAQARDIALENGDIASFYALIAEPDSTREWDILLITQYSDSSSWANREEIFARIFESSNYERVPTGRPSSELREFVSGGVVMTPLVTRDGR